MVDGWVDQQLHGYRSGHQLLSASLKLPRSDQDLLDRLSDASGTLSPGEVFSPYITAYPLPSRTHYVLARTWQDLNAPRAGCVVTRSLLIPMDLWETDNCPASALRLLVPVVESERASKQRLEQHQDPLPQATDQRLTELVEAIFFEPRQAIVMFDVPEAEAIAARLLTAFWPSLRQSFSLCTLAMSPRRIEGKDFDLVFVPKLSRTRFSDWRGRRIDASNATMPRHRWSEATTAQIFQSPKPSLGAIDNLGVLGRDTRGDESALRLSLLWNELSAKSVVSPTAVLGMLDIIGSQKAVTLEAKHELLPVVRRSIEMAKDSLTPLDALLFLSALVDKVRTIRGVPQSIYRQLIIAARKISSENASAAIGYLRDGQSRQVSDWMIAGVGDGSAMSTGERLLSSIETDSELLSRLIYRSFLFAQRAVSAASKDDAWISALVRSWQSSSRGEQKRIRNRLVHLLSGDSLVELVPHLLAGLEPKDLADYVVKIGRKLGFKSDRLTTYIVEAAELVDGMSAVRSAVYSSFAGAGAEQFLRSSLRFAPADIRWLETINHETACRLLTAILSRHSDREVSHILSDSGIAVVVVSILIRYPEIGAKQLARCLSLARVPVRCLAQGASGIASVLSKEEVSGFSRLALPELLAAADTSSADVSEAIIHLAPSVPVRSLIEMVTSHRIPATSVGACLLLISRPMRDQFLREVTFLSDRIIQTRMDIGESAFIAWADLIAGAGEVDQLEQERAASRSLAYALAMPFMQISSVIVVSFPIALASIRKTSAKKRSPSYFDFFFGNWDGEKALYADVAGAFMRSKWPPANLILAAGSSGAADKLLNEVGKRFGGEQYIAQIEEDARSRLSSDRRKYVLKCLGDTHKRDKHRG